MSGEASKLLLGLSGVQTQTQLDTFYHLLAKWSYQNVKPKEWFQFKKKLAQREFETIDRSKPPEVRCVLVGMANLMSHSEVEQCLALIKRHKDGDSEMGIVPLSSESISHAVHDAFRAATVNVKKQGVVSHFTCLKLTKTAQKDLTPASKQDEKCKADQKDLSMEFLIAELQELKLENESLS